MKHPADTVLAGPILFARGGDADGAHLAALAVTAQSVGEPPPLQPMGGAAVAPQRLWRGAGKSVWRYPFTLPAAADAFYLFAGRRLPVASDLRADLRIAFVSCNGDAGERFDPPEPERNALWQELAGQHRERPFQLLLHGGDQIYADTVWRCQPALAAWQRDAGPEHGAETDFSEAMAEAVLAFYVERYLQVYSQAPTAYLLARVPSLMMWDDHDIFDGWGSHPDWLQHSAVAQGIYRIAREAFCVFQLAAEPSAPGGDSLSWQVDYPGLQLLAPDLRSERGRHSVMSERGWQTFETMLERTAPDTRALLLSSVPVIGPRLSLLEALFGWLPQAQKYEDDLRDQWQSHAHREEWQRLLTLLERHVLQRGLALTILSGEIHLATRGVFETGGTTVHQLVASGIAHHAPPKLYAFALGLFARLGENPLPGRPTVLRPLPGRRGIYVAARNFLTLSRRGDDWRARWWLEHRGWTPPLAL